MVEHRNAAALSAVQQGHRWCKGVKVVVSDRGRRPSRPLGPRPPCAGPVPRDQMVHPGAPRRERPKGVKPAPRGARPGSSCCAEAHPHRRRHELSTPGWQALQFYTADDYDGALEALGRFCDLYGARVPRRHVHRMVRRSQLAPTAEGTNNLLQVLRRSAHGFTNPRNFEARGILVTNDPRPSYATTLSSIEKQWSAVQESYLFHIAGICVTTCNNSRDAPVYRDTPLDLVEAFASVCEADLDGPHDDEARPRIMAQSAFLQAPYQQSFRETLARTL